MSVLNLSQLCRSCSLMAERGFIGSSTPVESQTTIDGADSSPRLFIRRQSRRTNQTENPRFKGSRFQLGPKTTHSGGEILTITVRKSNWGTIKMGDLSESVIAQSKIHDVNNGVDVVRMGEVKEEEVLVNDHPIEEVRLTVPITDDPTLPVLTFRTWVLGLASCVFLSMLNQFFSFRYNGLWVGATSAQILVLPLGKLMAAFLPRTRFRVPFTNWSFSLNPGPFNLKEHVLITIFASCGADGTYALSIIVAIRAFYHRGIHIVAALLLVQTTQENFGGFTLYVVAWKYAPSLTFQDSITAQQLGSGLNGLGIGSFGLDWSTVAGSIWGQWQTASSGMGENFTDIHTRIMKRNYEAVPQWWFLVIMVISLSLSFVTIEGFGKQLQLPWWGLIMACSIALVATLPIGILVATTNQGVGLDVLTSLILGYLYPGRPLANVTFQTYGTISLGHARNFLQDFKLGHYMKIPPKYMFFVQLIGTIVATTVQFATTWWILSSIKNICDPKKLPVGSPWTCPGYDVFYSSSIIWGVVGPLRIFNDRGVYPQMNWFFLLGTLAPVPIWLLSRKYPEKKWIRQIYMPVFISSMGGLLPAKPIHYLSWGAVGVFFNYYIFRKHKGWWARHTYILSAALDVGIALLGLLLYVALQSREIFGLQWWGLEADDHCPLAKCPTVPGIEVQGCPKIH
ncbi:unnamed protein product [Linum tenue]|uniref:Oligopeptide transporter n=1 Tax=Linum tenue TaxID=586396 RepID=A0AAV0LU08_9ROSI|nr:unnamed protein product [Linum tenue]